MTKERFILLLLVFFSVSISWAQKTTTKAIVWRAPDQIYNESGVQITVLDFVGASYSSENSYLPTLKININNAESVNFSVINPVFAPLTEQELNLINSIKVPSNYGIKVSFGMERKVPVSIVSLIPIAINPSSGGYEKLVSFQYTYQVVSLRQAAVTNAVNYGTTTTSVLSSGNWYKLSIPSTGIYKIDYAFLQSMGIQPGNVNPTTIRLLGNGGGMLPQPITSSRPDDLSENAIYVYNGGNAQTFDNGDYVLFYGTGPDTWSYNSSTGLYNHTKNIYSDSTFYFLTYGGAQGIRINTALSPSSGSENSITTYTEHAFHESDQQNLLTSGRQWFGETFDETTTLSLSLPFTFDGLVQGTTTPANKITASVVGDIVSTSSTFTAFEIFANGTTVGTISIPYIYNDGSAYLPVGTQVTNTFTISPLTQNTNTVTVELTYNQEGNASAIGYLDYIEVNLQRIIGLYGNQTNFRCIPQSFSVTGFTVSNVPDTTATIWDVTSPLTPQNQPYTFANQQAVFTSNAASGKEYVVFQGNGFNNPSFVGQVSNQNLHGITSAIPTLAIVTTNAFTNEATKFQTFKQGQGISTSIYYLEEIYNEFSSGAQDITAIRDFMRMLYNRSANLKYLLLFGDCSYDYKNRISNNTNIVPIYESYQSLDPTSTFSSDDYYALLDTNEGAWPENSSDANSLLDLGVGRFPVKTSSDADAIINKINNYVTNPNTLGKWRNQVTIVTGIDPTNSIDFLGDAETDVVPYIGNAYNIDKLYMGAYQAYPLVSTPDGTTCPDMNTAIQEEIEKGTLLVDYLGHGGETVWAQQVILDVAMINQWTNINQLPFFITATCDFGRYDNPAIISGAETLLTLAQGGGIGTLASTRPVFQNYNDVINTAFVQTVFTPVNTTMPSLGYVMMTAKNLSTSGVFNRNYALLGDPSLTLAYPADQINVTKITTTTTTNNIVVTTITDSLKALRKITIAGELRSHIDSSLLNTFNGTLYITVLDKPSEVTASPEDFYTWNNYLYEGSASVTNGLFTLSFIVPKDINYNYGYGKLSLYAEKTGTLNDAHGVDTNIIVGGSDSNHVVDITPPTIKLFMQDTTFVNGGITSSNTVLIVHLKDASGINVSDESPGHGITAVLDNNTEKINLNTYYIANKDQFTSGTINFPVNGLSPGMHTLQVTAWDTYDNSAVTTIEFEVASNASLAVQNVLNYPNPFTTSTTFYFDQNREGDDLEVLIQIYTSSGQLIHTIDEKILSSTAHIAAAEWNGRDDFKDKIGNGVYIYKLKVRSLRDGSDTFKYQKLVILN